MNLFAKAAQEGTFLFLGHMGAYGDCPANTLSSCRKAIELGAHGLETDLHRTLDGRIVLMHDDDVSTATLSTGRITQMTYEEVRRLNAAGRFRPEFPAEPVPSLDELLELVRNVPGFLLNLEFKDYPEEIGDAAYLCIDETVRLVEAAGMGERVMFSTLSCGVLRHIIEKYGDRYPLEIIYPGFLMKGSVSDDLFEKSTYVGMINVLVREDGSHDWGNALRDPVMSHEDHEKVRRWNLRPCISLSPWDTVENVQKCLDEGYTMFICNYPSNAKRIFEQLGLI